MRPLIFIFCIICLLACGKKTGGNPEPETAYTEDPAFSLKQMPFPFGAAVSADYLKTSRAYSDLVKHEFASITTENAMKFRFLHPQKSTYDYTDADQIVQFALANGQRVHGHCLIWSVNLPDWVNNFNGDAADWEAIFRSHIINVVTHFKGKVKSWDVVNEAFESDGNLRTNSIWRQKLGPDYVARAFQYAHEADPDALLFYNDFGQEYNEAKRKGISNMISDFKTRGIPIDGIGLQMHTDYRQPEADITTAMNWAAGTGLKVHISELDVALNPDFNPVAFYTVNLAEQQAARYKSIVKAYYAIPKAQQFGITTWNVTDGDSWIPVSYKRKDWPLPFDAAYKRKQAYFGILDGVK